jgi:hypothetical protein
MCIVNDEDWALWIYIYIYIYIYMYSDEAFLYFGKRIREKNVLSFGYELIDIHKKSRIQLSFVMALPKTDE